MRIVCLSAESADICARLGAWNEVLAVSAFAPQRGLEPRPVIGGFSSADVERVASFRPDLVITFSDVQAEISAELIRTGHTVLATNQRTLAEIAQVIAIIGGAIGRGIEAELLCERFRNELADLRVEPELHPRIYFEEWPKPLVSGIGWVSEIIELTGGHDIFGARCSKAARDRVVTPEEVIAADPQIILASWCGKPVDTRLITTRSGFQDMEAVREGAIHEIPSGCILQPGPGLLEGARRIRDIIVDWQTRR